MTDYQESAADLLSMLAYSGDPTGTTVALDTAFEAVSRLIAEAQAEAWSNGFFAAVDSAPGGVWYAAWDNEPNPYREDRA